MYDFSELYVAGSQSTAYSAMMILYFMAIYPDVRNRLMNEIDKYVKSDEDVVHENVKQMVYLDCVLHESFRIYLSIDGIFVRLATKDHFLGDLKVLKGTWIMHGFLSMQYNPANYEKPTEFIPERWLNDDGTLKTPKPYTWMAFSSGARNCLGRHLALLELRLIVIQFLRKYDLTLETTDWRMVF